MTIICMVQFIQWSNNSESHQKYICTNFLLGRRKFLLLLLLFKKGGKECFNAVKKRQRVTVNIPSARSLSHGGTPASLYRSLSLSLFGASFSPKSHSASCLSTTLPVDSTWGINPILRKIRVRFRFADSGILVSWDEGHRFSGFTLVFHLSPRLPWP